MGYISVGRPLVDSDNDGTVDGILNRINAGSGMDITYSASTGILTLAVDASELGTGTGITFSSGAPLKWRWLQRRPRCRLHQRELVQEDRWRLGVHGPVSEFEKN